MTRQMLLTQVWGTGYGADSHYLHVYIGQLRRKIEPDPAHPHFILTVPGVGYRNLLVTVNTPGYVVASRRGRYSDITPQQRLTSGELTSVESVDRYRPLATRGVALALLVPGADYRLGWVVTRL